MLDVNTLRDMWSWDGRNRARASFSRRPQFTAQGLELGAGTVIVYTVTDDTGRAELDLRDDGGRAIALLSVAYGKPIGEWETARLRAASAAFQKRDLSLAHIILAHAGIGALEEGEDAPRRLYWAEKLLEWGLSPGDLVKRAGLPFEDWELDKAEWNSDAHPRQPKGAEGGIGGRFAPKDALPGIGHNQGPPLIPEEMPATRGAQAKIIAPVIRRLLGWMAEAGLAAADITAPEIVIPIQIGIAVGTWAYPFIRAYFDPPKSLADLQDAAAEGPETGYDIHHIVEQGAQPESGSAFPQDQMNGPDNLVRIPMLKHWELNRWYEKPDPEYGGLSPREYCRGKDWETQQRVGLDGLRKVGVLAP